MVTDYHGVGIGLVELDEEGTKGAFLGWGASVGVVGRGRG